VDARVTPNPTPFNSGRGRPTATFTSYFYHSLLHIAIFFSCHRCHIILLPFIFNNGIVSCCLGSCKDKHDGERNYRILKERSKWKNQRSGKKTRAVCFGLAGKIMHGWSNVMVALEVKHGPHMVNSFSTKIV
jgi:hypothetical protein